MNDAGQAFPSTKIGIGATDQQVCLGMTLRDYFAAKALQAIATSRFGSQEILLDLHIESLAIDSYAIADAMLKAREVE